MPVWKKPGLGQRRYLRPDELSVKLVNVGGITHIETGRLLRRILMELFHRRRIAPIPALVSLYYGYTDFASIRLSTKNPMIPCARHTTCYSVIFGTKPDRVMA